MSLVLDSKILTQAGAQIVVDVALAEAKKNGVAVTIAVLDSGGELLLLVRMDGAHTGTIEVAIAKANSAIKFRRSTTGFAEGLAKGGFGLLALPNVVPFPGGVPLRAGGMLVGAIGISGASPEVDGAIADAGAARLEHGE